MRAIHVRKSTGGLTVHWLLDPGRTYCGRRVDALVVEGELELERLPELEGCRGCGRALEGWPRALREEGERRVVLPASTGRLRTSGPLAHGTRPRFGRRLP